MQGTGFELQEKGLGFKLSDRACSDTPLQGMKNEILAVGGLGIWKIY